MKIRVIRGKKELEAGVFRVVPERLLIGIIRFRLHLGDQLKGVVGVISFGHMGDVTDMIFVSGEMTLGQVTVGPKCAENANVQ